ncbi:MAG: FtsX-like permease family protein [Roseivirga sp.]|nr:FtsX-like permease family protein [Roseivirga sp.]
MSQKIHIPKIPHAFFKWYCKKDRYEELHGDLEEFFYERVAESGPVKARLLYWRDVMRCCQPYAWKKPQGRLNSNIVMLKNYFKTSLRSMVRNPLSSFINVFGLAVAIGVCIVVYSMVQFSYSTDQFHEHKNEVFLTTFEADRDGTSTRYGFTPTPLGELLAQDFAQITKMARIKDEAVVVKQGENVFHETIRFTDSDFLDMLSFPLKWGDKSSLNDPNSIILSSDMAIKYFGETEPLGEEVLVKFSEERKKVFKVAGVAEAFPGAHAISFDFLINFENLRQADPDFSATNWAAFVQATLIQVDQASAIASIAAGMEKYRVLQNEVDNEWKITGFGFEPIASLHENSSTISGDISSDQADEILIGLPIMGIFMLALACFNYMNMAIGSATKRLKEIGVRKVIGASRNKVIFQFLAENVFVTFFALILGLFLTSTLFLPWFSEIAGAQLSLSLLNTDLWSFLIGILLLTGLVSGFYPALYISGFQVVKIFKGTVKFGKKNPIMKTFLGVQMILAFVFITMAVMFKQNSDFQAKRPWGYNQNGVLYVGVPDESAYDQLLAAMEQNPNVESVSGSGDHLGKSISSAVVSFADRSYDVQRMLIHANYFETLGIPMASGAIFNDQPGATKQVVVNELFVKNTLLDEPIGHLFKIDSTQYQIIGVAKDFHAFNFYYPMKPMVFQAAAKADYRFISMRVTSGSELAVYEDLKENWANLFPESPFQGGEQIDLWAKFYADLAQMKRFTRTVAFIAIMLAALGLYGLVTLNVSGRIKEFSIRKILGAGLLNISRSIGRQYLLLMVVALLLGAPLAYIMNIGLVKMMFAYPLPHGHWSVALAFVLLVFVMLMVIATQIKKVSRSNPAKGLRAE